MIFWKKIYYKINTNKTFYFMFLPTAFLLFTVAFLLLMYPKTASEGVKKGITFCLETVIPSLFPFLIVSNIAFDSGIFDLISKRCEKITSLLFNLPSVAFPIILMSMLGGFPIGALLTSKAFEKEQLTQSQAERMMMFCVNPGPAFVISTIGYSIIGSKEAGIIIFLATTASSLIIGVLSRFLSDDETFVSSVRSKKDNIILSSALAESVSTSTRNMINICVWIVIFSSLGGLAQIILPNKESLLFFRMVAEVTNGVVTASEYFTLPIITAVISFGGFCVHFQILPYLTKMKIKYKYFLSVRILSAGLSCVLTFLITELFPRYAQVSAIGTKPETACVETSFPVCVWLMLMCGLYIIGDSYVLNKKTKKEEAVSL